jgi:hypothetical protein
MEYKINRDPVSLVVMLQDHEDKGMNTLPSSIEFRRGTRKVKVSNEQLFELLAEVFGEVTSYSDTQT